MFVVSLSQALVSFTPAHTTHKRSPNDQHTQPAKSCGMKNLIVSTAFLI